MWSGTSVLPIYSKILRLNIWKSINNPGFMQIFLENGTQNT